MAAVEGGEGGLALGVLLFALLLGGGGLGGLGLLLLLVQLLDRLDLLLQLHAPEKLN